MSLTARQLNRATLARQLLQRREPLKVVEAVHRIVALQAQEPGSPYLALWNRVAGFDAADLDAAFAEHLVVKSSLLRLTLHAVHADDYPPFHAAMQSSLRAARLNDMRFTAAGLTTADAEALLADVVAFMAQPRTKAQIEARIAERLGERHHPRAWWALKMFAPLHHEPTGRPWSFGKSSAFTASSLFVAAPDVSAASAAAWSADPEKPLQRLLRRYLEGFGPASLRDFTQFTLLRMPVVREAAEVLERAGDIVKLESPDGVELLDVPGGIVPNEDTPAPPRLLPMWDSVLLAYADRSRVIPPDYRRLVIRQNGDTLPTLLIDGFVAGVWRPVEGGIEATAFDRLPDDVWDGLATEAVALVAFLADRDPAVYRRYGHWWKALPSAEVRVLPG